MTKIDLSALIFEKTEEIGAEAAAAFFGKPLNTIKKWQAGTAFPDVTAAQKILDEVLAKGEDMIPVFDRPPEQGKTIPDKAPGTQAKPEPEEEKDEAPAPAPERRPVNPQGIKKFSIATPINREMSFVVVQSLLGQWKATLPPEIQELLGTMDFENDTTPHMARNRLATRFLASGNEWSLWMDSDIIAPTGRPDWFAKRTGSKHDPKWSSEAAIKRLTRQGKTLIGSVYRERNQTGAILANPMEGDKVTIEDIHLKGPQDSVIQVNWVGFGCVAVHRSVFEAILKNQPELTGTDGEAHRFFNPIENGPQNEDVAFCLRARNAGHPAFLDLAVHCGHIGKFAFLP